MTYKCAKQVFTQSRFPKGFTLLELLVVILIIGILAAVAVPQYQKAVWKSRYIQAKTLSKSIAQAEEVYYMAHGAYTSQFDDLDIAIQPTEPITCYTGYCTAQFSWGSCTLVSSAATGRGNVQCTVTKNQSAFLMYVLGFAQSTWDQNAAECVAFGKDAKPTASDINYQICVNETGSISGHGFGENSIGWDYP